MVNRPVTFEVKKCHNCSEPATMTCHDCNKPVCGTCRQVAEYKDQKTRCSGCHATFAKKNGSGIK